MRSTFRILLTILSALLCLSLTIPLLRSFKSSPDNLVWVRATHYGTEDDPGPQFGQHLRIESRRGTLHCRYVRTSDTLTGDASTSREWGAPNITSEVLSNINDRANIRSTFIRTCPITLDEPPTEPGPLWGRLIDWCSFCGCGYDSYWAAVPLWPLIAISALLPLASLRSILRRAQSSKLRTAGHCSNCAYDLRASPDRCPECGTLPSP